jgi:hypothetical protein
MDESPQLLVSMALRYFAGGSPVDICVLHGVAHSEVFASAWQVVDGVNQCESPAMSFPSCCMEQQRLAAEFLQVVVPACKPALEPSTAC